MNVRKSLSSKLSISEKKLSSRYDNLPMNAEFDTDNDLVDQLDEVEGSNFALKSPRKSVSEKSKSLSKKLSVGEKKLSSKYENVQINEQDTDNDMLDELEEIETSNIALKSPRKSISEKSKSLSKKLNSGEKKLSSRYDNVQINEEDTDNDMLEELEIEAKSSALRSPRKSLSEKSKSLSRSLGNSENKAISLKSENVHQYEMDTEKGMEGLTGPKSPRKSISEKSKSLSKRSLQKSNSRYENLQENIELDTDNDIVDDLEDIEVAKVAGLPKFPVNNEEPMHTNPSPLGDRASPEGIEDIKPHNENKRNSIYDNIPTVNEPEKIDLENLKTPTQLFISRHTNIDDLLGGSCHPMSPVMDRIFVVEDLKEPEADVFNISNVEETNVVNEISSSRKGSMAMEM